MKTYMQILIIAVFALAFPAFALAAGADAPAAVESTPWQLGIITVLTPVIIAGVKMLVPKINTTLIPILAPVVGCVLDIVLWASGLADLNIWLAMGLGLAGVGLREVVDQLGKPRET